MLEKLKRYYQNHIVMDRNIHNEEQYRWYMQEDGTALGIEKDILTKQEKELLSIFLQPYSSKQLTEIQQRWQRIIDGAKEEAPYFPVRFVYFAFNEKVEEESEVEEALSGMLPYPFTLIWYGPKEGVIVEEYNDLDTVSYESIIDAFASDFFVTMKIFIGSVHETMESMEAKIKLERRCKELVFKMDTKVKLHTAVSILPILLLQGISPEEKQLFVESILGNVLEEKDLLKTIAIFLQCNQNVTLAAKTQYMHRNSVQYRVDKFIEKVGIDIKTFEGAALVYLALLCQKESLFTLHKES